MDCHALLLWIFLDPGIKHWSLMSLALAAGVGGSLPLGPPGKPHANYRCLYCVLRHFSHFWLCAALWTVALGYILSMAFSRQEYWSGLQCPSPEDLSNPGIKPMSLTSPALAGEFFTSSATWESCRKSKGPQILSPSGDGRTTTSGRSVEPFAVLNQGQLVLSPLIRWVSIAFVSQFVC